MNTMGNVALRHIDILAAYREDRSRRGALPIDHCEGEWVRLGLLLAHAATFARSAMDAERRAARNEAVLAARQLLDPATWRQGYRLDPTPPPDDDALDGRIRCIAEAVEDAGALRLADAILRAYLESHPDCNAIEQGRIEMARARIAWKRGDTEVARDRYAHVGALARQLGSAELRVRTLIGAAVLARLSGNYPASYAKARAACRLAERERMPRLAASAHHTIMVAAAVRQEFAEAITHGWSAYMQADGDTILESEILGNLGQVFLDLGHPVTAVAAFRTVIGRVLPSRVIIPALGGFAIASARLGDNASVQEAAERIAQFASTGGTPYAIAAAWLDLSAAYDICGQHLASRRSRRSAQDIAREHGYHELEYRAEHLAHAVKPEPRALKPRQASVAHAVRELVHA